MRRVIDVLHQISHDLSCSHRLGGPTGNYSARILGNPFEFSAYGGESGVGLALFVKFWREQTVHPAMMRTIALDIYARLHDKDKAYCRESREARSGTTRESFVLLPEESVPALRHAVAPLRATLERQPFIAARRRGGSRCVD